jgi:hypothetical protein
MHLACSTATHKGPTGLEGPLVIAPSGADRSPGGPSIGPRRASLAPWVASRLRARMAVDAGEVTQHQRASSRGMGDTRSQPQERRDRVG